jgi:hypothetical protein
MTISRNISVMAQGASTSGILAGGYGGLGASIAPTTAGNTIFTTDGSTWSSTQKIVRGTSVATTSGTSVSFTGIPSWVKRITLMLNGVSTNGSSFVQAQLGSTTFTTSGYVGCEVLSGGTNFAAGLNLSAGFMIAYNGAADTRYGSMVFTNISGNIWICQYIIGVSNTNVSGYGSGSVTLSGVLDRVQLTTVNGTDTFDAGSVNILYE